MQRKEIEKEYIKKIKELKRHDRAYFEKDNPLITDKNYDLASKISQDIINEMWERRKDFEASS